MEMQLDNVTGNHRITVTIREFSRMVGLSEPSIRGEMARSATAHPWPCEGRGPAHRAIQRTLPSSV